MEIARPATFTTTELRIPRNLIRFFETLTRAFENKGDFNPYTDTRTREETFDAPTFLMYNQALLDDIITLYNTHYYYNRAITQFNDDGLKSDIKPEILLAYRPGITNFITHINFLDYYGAFILLNAFITSLRKLIHSQPRDQPPPVSIPDLEPLVGIEKVFIKEATFRKKMMWYLRQRLNSLDVFETVTYNIWPKLGPCVLCLGDRTFVVTPEGLFGFGYNGDGSLGLGDTEIVEIPTKIPLENVLSITGNEVYTLFITSDGVFECGRSVIFDSYKEDAYDIKTPKKIFDTLRPIISVVCGREHAIILCQNGDIYGYGSNTEGQLGILLTPVTPSQTYVNPVRVDTIKDVLAIACGNNHSLVLTKEGLFGCGENGYGKLGLGHTRNVYEWTKLPIQKVISFWCGDYRTMVLTEDGLFACGSNYNGCLGLGESSWDAYDPDIDNADEVATISTFTRVPIEGVLSIVFTGNYTLFLTKEGLYACGEIGHFGSSYLTDEYYTPIRIPIDNVISIATNHGASVIMTLDGVYVVGQNYNNNLGLPDTKYVSRFTKLTSLRVGIEESPKLTIDEASQLKNEKEPVTKKRRTDSLLCTRCNEMAIHVEPFQERYRFCSDACYQDFFTPKSGIIHEY